LEMQIDPILQTLSDNIENDFSHITGSFVRLAEGDEDSDDGSLQWPSEISIKISDLFDFSKTHWVSLHKRSASHSLDEELEFYELLDLDAPGEEDINLDMDQALDSVLHV